jgi:hypothetical protein
VLAAILSGSRFDYVALDRSDSPGIVQRVLLMPHAGNAAPATVASVPVASTPVDNDDEDAANNNEEDAQDTPARPPVLQAQPTSPPQPLPPQSNLTLQGDNAAKTPEQLLEELKSLQQRQQQQPQQAAPQKTPQ